jgi:hypothetical protein
MGEGPMIRLSHIIEQFETNFRQRYGKQLLPSQRKALAAIQSCRSHYSPLMQAHCESCDNDQYFPHSCGNRHCPHCQHHESQQWLENQGRKQVPVRYFMVTFTVPAQLRSLFFHHQRQCYGLLFDCAWDTLQTFSQNDKKLNGTPGAIAVLHTHSRSLAYHPHIHVLIPAAAIDKVNRLWREKQSKYLFNHKALAKVFRAKLLEAIVEEKLQLPDDCPKHWVVDCKSVGSGENALVYLGRYLYRGVIQEKDILSCHNGKVTFRYIDSKTERYQCRTVSGADFLWLVLQHVLPRGFRRARNYGFLHPNSKTLIRLLTRVFQFDPARFLKKHKPRSQLLCACCGHPMRIVKTRIDRFARQVLAPV